MTIRPEALQEEAVALQHWAQAFERKHGGAPTFTALGDGLSTITFPPVIRPEQLLGSTGHFRHHPAMEEHVRQLGFAWDASGRIRTAPTPASFLVLLDRSGFTNSGCLPQLFVEERTGIPLGRWLTLSLDGVLPLQVSTAHWYEKCLAGEAPTPAVNRLGFQLVSLAHDLTVHVLNYHLIPEGVFQDLRSRIVAAMPDRAAAWLVADASAPLTLTYFLDNDLNRYCYAVWCLTKRPADFAVIFQAPPHLAQLHRALDIRIAETLAGKGDVPSGSTNDMGPLEPTSFDLR